MGRRRSVSRSSSESRNGVKHRLESESPRRSRRSYSRSSPYTKRRTPPSPSPGRYEKRRSYDSRSRSPAGRRGGGGRGRGGADRGERRATKPPPSRCLGVFGMSIHTSERTIRDIFNKFGDIEHISMITCTHTGRFRGYCFVYYDNMEDSKVAKDHCNGMEIDGRRVRVDYSYTTRAHTPTPGQYKGRPHQRRERSRREYGGGDRGGDRGGGGRSRYRSRSRSRSPYSGGGAGGGGGRRRYSRSRSR